MPQPRDAVELTVSTGYARTRSNRSATSWSGIGEGISSELGIGVRSLQWSVGLLGQYAELGRDRRGGAYTGSAGIAVAYHVMPDTRVDPWLGVTVGYRFIRTGGESHHGLEIVRLNAGADLRTTSLLAVGPRVSAGIDVFPSQLAGDAGWVLIGMVGIAGRFELSTAIVAD